MTSLIKKQETVSTTINGYEIFEVLGKGSFGQVFKAKKEDQIYALKLLDLNMIKSRKIEKFVSNEINLMRQLNHKNVVKIYEVFQTTSVIFLVLEFCNQGTLLTYVSKKKPTQSECAELLLQILAGVKHIHEHKILHRDLKPENIFLHNGVLKIADFGLAQIENEDFVYCGTSFYMAPEILQRKQVTYKSDLWSLGIIMYYMVFRRLPFYSKSNLQATIKKWTDPYMDVIRFLEDQQTQFIAVEDDIYEFFQNVLVYDPALRASFKDLYNLPLIQKKILDIDYKESLIFYSNLNNLQDGSIQQNHHQQVVEENQNNQSKILDQVNASIDAKKEVKSQVQPITPVTLQDLSLNHDSNSKKSAIIAIPYALPSPSRSYSMMAPIASDSVVGTSKAPLIQITSSSILEDIPEDDYPNICQIYPKRNLTYFDKKREQQQQQQQYIKSQTANLIPSRQYSIRNISQSIDIQVIDFLTPKRFSAIDIPNPRILSDFEPLQQHQAIKDHSQSNQDIANLSTYLKSSLFISDQECQDYSEEIEVVRSLVFKYQLLEEIMTDIEEFRMGFSTQSLLFYIISKFIVFIAGKAVKILSLTPEQIQRESDNMKKFKQTKKAKLMLSFVLTDLTYWETKVLINRNGIDVTNDIKDEKLFKLITENPGDQENIEELISPFSLVLELMFEISFKLSLQQKEQIRFKKYCILLIFIIDIQLLFNKSKKEQLLLKEYFIENQNIEPKKLMSYISEIKSPQLFDSLLLRFVSASAFSIPNIKAIDFFKYNKDI